MAHDGFIPCFKNPRGLPGGHITCCYETVSAALELGLNAHCVAVLAEHFGENSVADKFKTLAQSYRLHYDSESTYLVGVKDSGGFCRSHSVTAVPDVSELYTEGNALTWFFSVPHDIEGLVELIGGRDAFRDRLNTLFTSKIGELEIKKMDYSGLVGAYAHGNEPTHHVPFLFQTALGDATTTNYYVDHILNNLYDDTPKGLPGNDDAGQMSAWYVLAFIGVYPVDPTAIEMVKFQPAVINVE